jgi:hypothetical protein
MITSRIQRTLGTPSALAVGLLMVVGSLLILLVFQYNWLRHVERVSAFAYRATLHGYLDAVSAEVELFYRDTAERLLEPMRSLRFGARNPPRESASSF